MADNEEVFRKIDKKPGVSYPVLVPNAKGLEKAVSAYRYFLFVSDYIVTI